MKIYRKKLTYDEWHAQRHMAAYVTASCEQKKEVINLLKSLCNSLNMELVPRMNPQSFKDVLDGFGNSKNGTNWARRFKVWANSSKPPEAWLGFDEGVFYITTDTGAALSFEDEVSSYSPQLLPIFPHYNFDFKLFFTQKEQSSMKTLDKNFVDRLLNQNKDAVKLSAKMGVGKAANQVLTSKLAGTFPWYAKLFGKHRETVNNPFVRVGTAEMVMAAAEHFYPDNEKLKYVAEAMLQEAMVDVVTNSNQFKGILSELEALAGQLPSETK